MSNYETLVRILDQIRKQAPAQYKSYYPLETETEKLNQARSKAFIHLYLEVKFGLLDFEERQQYITDDIDDGGIDGYYLDEEDKRIYLIQSKFGTKEYTFQEKEIQLQELLKMDVDRITKGETCYEDGKEYNGKIQELIKEIADIKDIARWDYQVVILANLKSIPSSDLRKLTGGFECEVVDSHRCYNELVFPVVTGTYFSASDLYIYLNVTDRSAGSRIRYNVETEHGNCEITVAFVPTMEIAKTMHKYKNSILKFNPRSYLDLSRNPVNTEIAKTILEKETNEFALYNNGITMLSDDTSFTEHTAQKYKAQLKLTNPQIINGGQTAYTLSSIYESNLQKEDPENTFEAKEVLVKVITFTDSVGSNADLSDRLRLIESISKATNQQTNVTDADRRSNDRIQVEIQQKIFDQFAYFYVRKRGEFWDGIQNGYVDQSKVIDRETFLRICLSCNGFPAQARRSSENMIFSQGKLYDTVNDLSRLREYFFAFMCYDALSRIQKKFDKDAHNRYGVVNYGNALRYGKMAVIAVADKKFNKEMNDDEIGKRAEEAANECLDKWLEFEKHVATLKHNDDYFRMYADVESGTAWREMNYDNYYKGRTLNSDLKAYSKFKSLSDTSKQAGTDET